MVSAILVLVGVLALTAMAYGALSSFAGAMSDNPMSGRAEADNGAVTFVVGAVILLAVIIFGVWRWLHGA